MAANITRTKESEPNAGAATSTAKAGSLRRAYVTFLAGNGSGNLRGVIGLAKGLRKVGSKFPLVVAVLPGVPQQHRKELHDLGCILKEIEPVNPQTQLAMVSHDEINYPELQLIKIKKYSKLRIWQFAEYSKMIYLEGDCQVYSNIDDLFEFNDGYIYAPRQLWPEFLMWPTEFDTPKPSYYFNASMFVFEPGASIFNDLLVLLNKITSIPLIRLDDQLHVLILLNMFFRKKLMGLPEHNYMALTMLQNHKKNVDLNEVKVIHYCSPELRPWRYTPERVNVDIELVNKLKEKWLCIFRDESLKPKEETKITGDEDINQKVNWSREVAFFWCKDEIALNVKDTEHAWDIQSRSYQYQEK